MACPNNIRAGGELIRALSSVSSPLFYFIGVKKKGRKKIMRKYLKQSGVAGIILITIAAIAFLPKTIAQGVILAAFTVFFISKGTLYVLDNKEMFTHKRENLTSKRQRKNAPVIPLEFKYAVNQLSHRVTDKLHSAFPEATWHWLEKPTAKLFTDGGRIRIATEKSENFTEADVLLDTFGRIEIKMLEVNSVSDIVKATSENAETEFTVDTRVWYEQCGQKVLTDIITDLNARGTRNLCINEDGSIVIDDNKQVGTLKAFPAKNLWKKLAGIFEDSGLTVVENEHSIQLGW